MSRQALQRLFEEQAGVVSRRQVIADGYDDVFIERRLRRKDWAVVRSGIYVDHTGELSWPQRAWSALLFHWPAVLSHESALTAWGVRNVADGTIHVAIDQSRRVRRSSGITVHRVTGLAAHVQPGRRPPRLRLERCLVDVAASASSEAAALAVLADACQSGRTTPQRLVTELNERPRVPRRRMLLAVLDDVATGTHSVLEHRYLTLVERPHGLPRACRQRRVQSGPGAAYRDVDYVPFATVVELDGRLGHETALDRWADMDRDIVAAVSGALTVRVGWGHVLDPCRTAAAIGRVLQARGWDGQLRSCSSSPLIGACSALRAGDVPMSR